MFKNWTPKQRKIAVIVIILIIVITVAVLVMRARKKKKEQGSLGLNSPGNQAPNTTPPGRTPDSVIPKEDQYRKGPDNRPATPAAQPAQNPNQQQRPRNTNPNPQPNAGPRHNPPPATQSVPNADEVSLGKGSPAPSAGNNPGHIPNTGPMEKIKKSMPEAAFGD